MADVAILVGVPRPDDFDADDGTHYSWDPLGGVENDFRAFRTMLLSALHPIPESAIITLIAETDTTAANILAVTKRQAQQLTAGDTLILFLDGHGYRTKDLSGDETDGWDEVFIASDRPVLDDQFAEIWAGTNPGATIIGLVDTCFASTSGLEGFQIPAPTVVTAEGPSRLFMFASEEDAVAREMTIRDRTRGVFSAAMEDAWSALPETHESFAQFFRATQDIVSARATQGARVQYIGADYPAAIARTPFVGT